MLKITTSSARVNLGGNLTYDSHLANDYFFNSDKSMFGIAAFGEYAFQGESGIRVGLQYSFPQKYVAYWYAVNPLNTSDFITVDGDYLYQVFRILLDGKHYFFNGSFDEGGFYFVAGVGLSVPGYKYNIDSYDSKYVIRGSTVNEMNNQFHIRIHIGYDLKTGIIRIFVEPGLDLAAGNVSAQTMDMNIPTFWTINAGLRFPLGH